MPLRFAESIFDGDTLELRRGGKVVSLPPRAFQLLALLLQQRPRPISHHQLRDALWPDAHVGYTSLAQLVTEVRKAIGDTDPRARLIRTVPRVGYAFVAPVVDEQQPGSPRLAGTFVAEDREFFIPQGETLVGRGTECGVRLPSARVSRVHARVRADARGVAVEDAGSKNGTWVNGARQQGPTLLSEGDEVAFGTYQVVFQSAGTSGSTRTGRPR
jgi:DNA-binding winged helix-turn-helix (wHTH) protein